MRVNREELLKVLESVSPGLAVRENVEQSSCLGFTDGRVVTFNEEISCSRESPINITGAVRAKQLLDILSKLSEDVIEVEATPSEFLIKAGQEKAGVRMENDFLLPIQSVETPGEWSKLDPEFLEAVSITHSCASSEESQFVLSCVHIHPDYLEACDRFQIARYPVKTGVQEEMLVRAESIRKVLGLDMTEISVTGSWVHFRNPAGLVFSCRRYLDQYKSLDKFISADGTTPMSIPGGLEEVIAKAKIFSSESTVRKHIKVDLKQDRIMIQGEGPSGWYKRIGQVSFKGDPISFLISPDLLLEVSKRSKECSVGQGRLHIDSGKFKYVTSTEVPKEKNGDDAGQ